MTLGRFTDDAADLRREAVALLRALAVPAAELRGLGLTVSRLDSDPAAHTSRPSAPAAAKLQVGWGPGGAWVGLGEAVGWGEGVCVCAESVHEPTMFGLVVGGFVGHTRWLQCAP